MAINIQKEFKKEDFLVRTVFYNNEVWFIAKDIIDCLGHTNITQALKHCEDAKGCTKIKVLTKGGEQDTIIINETNLYLLMMKSKKTKAKDFRIWIAGAILPSIRRDGKYEVQNGSDDNLLRHLNIEIQKQNVKVINAIKNKEGGIQALREYHNEICKVHTGLSATEIKKIAKDSGKFKSKVYNSAREVIRVTDKSIAGSMSITDQLSKANKEKSIKEIYEVSRLSIPLFRALEKSKLEHNFKELKK